MDTRAIICELVAPLRQCCKELEKIIALSHCNGTYKEACLRGQRALKQFDESELEI